jgi:hypothetical protein
MTTEAETRNAAWCKRFGIDLRHKRIRPAIRSEGVLCLIGRHDIYPLSEESSNLARTAVRVILERENKRQPIAAERGAIN